MKTVSVKLTKAAKSKLKEKIDARNAKARKRKLLGTEAPKTMGTSYGKDY